MLTTEVYLSPFHEIATTGQTFAATSSTLICGDRDAILIDAQHITADIDALADRIERSGRSLTTIFITHGHADHWFGVGRLLGRFPDARAVATSDVVDYIQENREVATGQWGFMFGTAVVEPTTLPERLDRDFLELEGHRFPIIPLPQADITPSTIVHIADLKTVVCGDVIYNRIHPMLGFTDRAGVSRWLESIDLVADLNPEMIVAGHKAPDAADTAVREMLDGTRQYLHAYVEAAEDAEDAEALIAAMTARFPTYGNPWTLSFSAQSWFGRQPVAR